MSDDDLNAATVHTLRVIGRFGGPHCVDRAVNLYLASAPASPGERALRLEELSAMLLLRAAAEPHVDNIYAVITDRIRHLTSYEAAG